MQQQVLNQRIESVLWKYIKHFPENINSNKLSDFINDITENKNNRVVELLAYRTQLYKLLETPQVEQRTPEWYSMRKDRLTASDTAQALGKSKYGSVNQLVEKKAFPDKFPFGNAMQVPALRHGVIYESMALRCYRQQNDNIKVHEFGMIAHPSLSCYGASPDGISELGIMIEIKCPLKRIIDGIIPDNYWYQMQGQMAVCDLKECDYIECDIQEFKVEDEYKQKVDNDKKTEHGIVLELNDEKLVYSPEYMTKDECINWIKTIDNVKKINYWYLRKMLVQRVKFDEEKWRECEPLIVKFWEKVETSRNNPQQPPKKKYMYLPDSDDDSD